MDQSGSICSDVNPCTTCTADRCPAEQPPLPGFAKTGDNTCCKNNADAGLFAEAFINATSNEFNGNVNVGFVSFATESFIQTVLTTAAGAITSIQNTVYTGGYTNTAAGIDSCRDVLRAGTSTKKILVLITDGIPTACTAGVDGCTKTCFGGDCPNGMPEDAADRQATDAKNIDRIAFIPVGVGKSIRTTNLRDWGTNGDYLTVADFNDLPDFVASLTDAIVCSN
jgi:hypothetical protein